VCRFAYRQWVSGAPLRTAELDVLIGHPEHDLLFIATQVARAAGLKNPSNRASLNAQYDPEQAIRVNRLPDWQSLPLNGRPDLQARSWIFTEGLVYRMLMSGRSPQSEPFRKWVTEEVLPSIRKTGQYNVNESTTETGQQYAGELAALSDAVSGLLKQNSTILGMLRRRQRGMLVNPSEQYSRSYVKSGGLAGSWPWRFGVATDCEAAPRAILKHSW